MKAMGLAVAQEDSSENAVKTQIWLPIATYRAETY
jgi:hypothetical protein